MPPKASAKVPPKAPAPSKAPAKAANYTGLKIAFFPTSFFKNKKTLLKEIFYQSNNILHWYNQTMCAIEIVTRH